MTYLLGISYNGEVMAQEEDRRLAEEEKSLLEKIASKFEGTPNFSNLLHPTFSFEKERLLIDFRSYLVRETKENHLHYHSIDAPVVNRL